SDEVPETVSQEELEEMFPEIVSDPDLLKQALDLELLAEEDDGYRIESPRLMKVGAELVSVGIPLSVVLGQASLLKSDTEDIAWRLVAMFGVYVWEPFVLGKTPDRTLQDITEILQRTRPLAAEAVAVFLAKAMQKATEGMATLEMPDR
ncbi:MAG: hypothetical protein WD627_02925, partial [Actinomycetota bacterium]